MRSVDSCLSAAAGLFFVWWKMGWKCGRMQVRYTGFARKDENMEENGKRENKVKTEQILDILCLAASYGILLLLPHKIGFLFYLIFGGSAFLFCIGFFRLGLSFDKPTDSKGELIAGLAYTVFGVLINMAGLYFIHQDQGSARSIMTATLLLIEALVMFTMAGGGFSTPEYHRLFAVLWRAAAVFLFIFGIAFAFWKHFKESSVMIATLLVIESICLWKVEYGSNPFNASNSEIQTVPGLRVPIRQLQQTFADVETQLGYPWIGKVKTISQDSIIYGPSEDGFVVYGYYLFGRFYVAGSTNPLFPDPENAQEHIVTQVPDSSGNLLNHEELTEAYARMFARYAENGKRKWNLEDQKDTEG